MDMYVLAVDDPCCRRKYMLPFNVSNKVSTLPLVCSTGPYEKVHSLYLGGFDSTRRFQRVEQYVHRPIYKYHGDPHRYGDSESILRGESIGFCPLLVEYFFNGFFLLFQNYPSKDKIREAYLIKNYTRVTVADLQRDSKIVR